MSPTVAAAAAAFSISLGLLAVARYIYQKWWRPVRSRTVAIVVLGDVGRSPRMMYHSQSFAKLGFDSFVVGYFETPLPRYLTQTTRIFPVGISQFPPIPRWIPFLLAAPFKVLWQTLGLLNALTARLSCSPEFIIVQNPPSIPTLAIVQLVAFLSGCKVIIDWHNLGYSILALRFKRDNIVIRAARWFERTFGRRAYAHLFVTHAMMQYLTSDWELKGTKVVLHDRPPAHFKPLNATEAHELFNRVSYLFDDLGTFLPPSNGTSSTSFTLTERRASGPDASLNSEKFRPDRPALLVSSTSWTADEDFSILLESLSLYEQRAKNLNSVYGSPSKLPKLLVVVTGKGPQKKYYMDAVALRQKDESWQWVRCISAWLSAEDYPRLLGCADLGVSLHRSSSSLDLPMKVVDMFGCGVPVCALQFPCLGELVKDGVNGLIFNDSTQLALHLQSTLAGFPNAIVLEKLRQSLAASNTSHDNGSWKWSTWDENWAQTVKPLVLSKS